MTTGEIDKNTSFCDQINFCNIQGTQVDIRLRTRRAHRTKNPTRIVPPSRSGRNGTARVSLGG